MLSRRPDADKGEDDNQDVTLLPPELFIRLAEGALEEQEEWVTLEQRVGQSQQRFLPVLQEWKDRNSIQQKPSLTTPGLKLWYLQEQIVIPPDEPLQREVLHYYHDLPTAGHLG